MVLDVVEKVSPEGADIGQSPQVDGQGLGADAGVVLPEFAVLVGNVVLEQLELRKALDFLLVQKAHRGHVDVHGPLDPPGAILAHPAPVSERSGDEVLRGDGAQGLVPVAHGDGVQSDVHHVAVHVVRGHLHPVPDPHDVVDGNLDARHDRQQGVAEHQQQHRRQRPQAAQQEQDRDFRGVSHDDQAADGIEHQRSRLRVSLERQAGVAARHFLQKDTGGLEQGRDAENNRQDHAGKRQYVQYAAGRLAQPGLRRTQPEEHHQCGRQVGKAQQDPRLEQGGAERPGVGGFQSTADCRGNHAPRQPVGQQRRHGQRKHHKNSRRDRV